MFSFIRLKYKESVFLMKSQGLKGFLKALRYFFIREFYEFVYRRKPDEKYYLLQNRMKKFRESKQQIKALKENIKSNPLVSILVYDIADNAESLQRSLLSISDQEYKNLEIVLLFKEQNNKGMTEKIIAELEDNISVSAVLKIGYPLEKDYKEILKTVTGEYLMFLCSGDLLEKDTFALLYPFDQ